MQLGFAAKMVFVDLVVIGCLISLGFSAAPKTPRTINIVAKRFTYEPDDITIKKGEPVVLILTTTDVTHGLKFKDLNLNTRVEKARRMNLPSHLSRPETLTDNVLCFVVLATAPCV